MSGHGHVVPNADGSRARCGGPAICAVCSLEAAQFMALSERVHADIRKKIGVEQGREPLKWMLSIGGWDPDRIRCWYEPIEDEE